MKRLRLTAILFVLLLLGWLAFLTWSEREPSYNGKALSEWLYQRRGYTNSAAGWIPIEDASTAAVRAIGTNGLPTLVRMVASHDGTMKLKLMKLLNSQRLIRLRLHTEFEKQTSAATAFQILGTDALPAVPALIELTKHEYPAVRFYALESLMAINPDKSTLLPVLTNLLADTDEHIRLYARDDRIACSTDETERIAIYRKYINIQLGPVHGMSPELTRSTTNAVGASASTDR